MTAMRRKCIGTAKSTGRRCERWATAGATVCFRHGAAAPQVRDKAAVRAAVMSWGLDDEKVDPGETLLRLLAQSARRVRAYTADLFAKVEEVGIEAAMVAISYGEGGPQGEYIRGLAELESTERDRCANFARLALAAGLEERRVRMAEQDSDVLSRVLTATFADPALGLSAEQRHAAVAVIRRHLAAA